MSGRSVAELFPVDDQTDFDPEFFNPLIREISQRIAALEILRGGLEVAFSQAQEITLLRVNDILGPAAVTVNGMIATLQGLLATAAADLEEGAEEALAQIQPQIDAIIAAATTATGQANTARDGANTAATAANAAAAGVAAAIAAAIVDMAKTSVAQQFTKPQRASATAIPSGTTMTADLAANNDFTVAAYAHTGTLANPTNQATQINQKGSITITQDGSGGHPLAFASNWKPFGQSTAPSINTTAGVTSVIDYHVISATVIRYTLRAIGA
jgi:hypothetical protein